MSEHTHPVPADRQPDVAAWIRDVLAGTRIITLRASLGVQPTPEVPSRWTPATAAGEPVLLQDEHRFGPLHPLVVARGHQILSMDARGALEFPHRTICVSHVGWGPDAALAAAGSAAARADRVAALTAAVEAGQELADLLQARPEASRSWWELRIPYAPGVLPDRGTSPRQVVRDMCEQGIIALLASTVVADLLPRALRARCTGPWEWAVFAGQIPGKAWVASPRTIDAVRGQLDLADDQAIRRAAACFAEARDTTDYRELLVRLEGYRTLGRCSPPLDRRILRASRARNLPKSVAGDGEQMGREVLTALTAPATVRDELWAQLTAPLADALPHLWRQPPPDLG